MKGFGRRPLRGPDGLHRGRRAKLVTQAGVLESATCCSNIGCSLIKYPIVTIELKCGEHTRVGGNGVLWLSQPKVALCGNLIHELKDAATIIVSGFKPFLTYC